MDNLEYLHKIKREYNREWRDSHKGYQKKWRQAHRGYTKKWAEEHKENTKETAKKWRQTNLDYAGKYLKSWYKTEKGKAHLQRGAFKRRTKEKLLTNTLTAKEWQNILELHNYMCIYCGKQFTMFEMTRDHIIPVSKGRDNIKENVVPACKSCNSKMNDNLELKMQVLKDRIKKGGSINDV